MSIIGLSSLSPYFSSTQSVNAAQGQSDQPTNGGEAHVHGHHHHGGGEGGGRVGAAMAQALQSLGLGLGSTTATSNAATSGSATGTDSDGDNDGSTSKSGSAGSVRKDLHQFMHALFQAARNAQSGNGTPSTDGSSSATVSSSSRQAQFASGLNAVISQVASGNAPADLQNTFNKLLADLQGSASVATTTSSTSTTASTPTLQDLLGKLQQNLGYGASVSGGSTGVILNAVA